MKTIDQKLIEHKRGIYCLMFGIALFMHFFRLSEVPYGLHVDEAGMAYDAYCLAKYSVDRYLNRFPVYLINFGGGQSALNAYLVAALIKIAGDINPWIIRLPGAIIAVFSYLAGVNIIRKSLGEKWGLVSSFFLAIFPYFIMQSRFGLDCNLLLGMSTISLYFLMFAEEKKKPMLFVLAGVLWGITYYTYALSYISNTMFLGVLLCYWLYMKRISWKNAFFFGLPVLLIVSPLLLMIIINTFDLPQIETTLFTIPSLPMYRNGSISFTNMWVNFWTTVKVIFTKDWIPYNAFDKYFTMYRLSIVFAVIGFFRLFVDMAKSFLRKEYSKHMVFFIFFLCYLFLGMLLGDGGPNINRLNGIFFALFYCVLYGMRYSYNFVKNYNFSIRGKDSLLRMVFDCPQIEKKAALVILVIYSCYFLTFANYYFNKYPEEMLPVLFADTYKDITDFIETETGEPKVVYTNTSYIFYYLSERLNPFEADLSQNGTDTYWKYVFSLPDGIDEGAIYVLKKDSETVQFIEKIETLGFEEYESGIFKCYYKSK